MSRKISQEICNFFIEEISELPAASGELFALT
jgi:hypothetical protein